MYLPKSPGQCRTRFTTIGSRKAALITATGIQTPRLVAKKDRAAVGSLRRLGQQSAASTASVSTGTNSRKHAWPWMRNQPARARIHASVSRPAATEPAAMRKTT